MEKKFSAVITKEGKWFVSYCPELGVASQGQTKKLHCSQIHLSCFNKPNIMFM